MDPFSSESLNRHNKAIGCEQSSVNNLQVTVKNETTIAGTNRSRPCNSQTKLNSNQTIKVFDINDQLEQLKVWWDEFDETQNLKSASSVGKKLQ